jgi:hypothetical protein
MLYYIYIDIQPTFGNPATLAPQMFHKDKKEPILDINIPQSVFNVRRLANRAVRHLWSPMRSCDVEVWYTRDSQRCKFFKPKENGKRDKRDTLIGKVQ